jgi:DNA-binding transcriptional MerR regulator
VSTLLNIGDFSRMTFLSVKTLRYYHDVGLLPPAEVDQETGYRRYELGQVPTAQVIRRLRELGMSIDDVRGVIEAPDVSARNAAISAHLQRMEGELEQTRATVKALRMLLDETGPPSIAVEYRVVEPSETLAISDRVAYADAFDWLDAAFSELRSVVSTERNGVDGALYSNELLEDEFGELVAVVPIGSPVRATGRSEPLQLPRVEYAVAVHVGSVDDIDRTYAALGAVVAERAIGVQGPIREDYVVGANDTADETQYRTEICWPVFQTTG